MSLRENMMRDTGFVTHTALAVDVYMHTISATEATLLRDVDLQYQFDVLRNHFAPYGINLNYVGYTRTVNAEWANDGNGQEMPMKTYLRQGSYQAMNFYMIDVLPTALGYCTFPTDTGGPGTDAFIRDGCTLVRTAIGPIGTHEAGHWFGLSHTFDGDSCDGPGDFVADTPAQAGPSSGCPTGHDSCPGHAGLDPIHNFMDYSSPYVLSHSPCLIPMNSPRVTDILT
jgi:hypothetical protein